MKRSFFSAPALALLATLAGAGPVKENAPAPAFAIQPCMAKPSGSPISGARYCYWTSARWLARPVEWKCRSYNAGISNISAGGWSSWGFWK